MRPAHHMHIAKDCWLKKFPWVLITTIAISAFVIPTTADFLIEFSYSQLILIFIALSLAGTVFFHLCKIIFCSIFMFCLARKWGASYSAAADFFADDPKLWESRNLTSEEFEYAQAKLRHRKALPMVSANQAKEMMAAEWQKAS